MFKSLLTLSVAVAATCGAAVPALAQPDQPPRVIVHYGDLDLSTASGREQFGARVRVAIRSMCDGPARDPLIITKCTRVANRSAAPQMRALFDRSPLRVASEKPSTVAAR